MIFWYVFHSRAYFLFESDFDRDLADVANYFVCKTPKAFSEVLLPSGYNVDLPCILGDDN